MKTGRILRAKCVNVQLNGTPDDDRRRVIEDESSFGNETIACHSVSSLEPCHPAFSRLYIIAPRYVLNRDGLNKKVCSSFRPSVRPSVHLSVRPSVCTFVRPFILNPISNIRERFVSCTYIRPCHILIRQDLKRIYGDIYSISIDELRHLFDIDIEELVFDIDMKELVSQF